MPVSKQSTKQSASRAFPSFVVLADRTLSVCQVTARVLAMLHMRSCTALSRYPGTALTRTAHTLMCHRPISSSLDYEHSRAGSNFKFHQRPLPASEPGPASTKKCPAIEPISVCAPSIRTCTPTGLQMSWEWLQEVWPVEPRQDIWSGILVVAYRPEISSHLGLDRNL